MPNGRRTYSERSDIPKRQPKPPKETARHLNAFEVWYNGGEPLSYTATVQALHAQKTPASRTCVAQWSIKFDWQGRAAKRLHDLKDTVDDDVVQELARQKKQMIAVVDMALARIQQALIGGSVTCPSCLVPAVCPKCKKEIPAARISLSVRDIEKLVTAKLKLLDQPDRVDVTSEGQSILDVVRLAIAAE